MSITCLRIPSKSAPVAALLAGLLVLVSCGKSVGLSTDPAHESSQISFNEHIRPILNKNCTGCHGGVTKQGNISYIFREEALGRGKSGRRNVVPGNAKASELYQRITSDDLARRMPFQKPPLDEEEIDLLTQWINEGAIWEEHWAFESPIKYALPEVERAGWSGSPIDQFVLAKMDEQGFSPNPEATKPEWLRRVSLDLIGLPPTPEQVDAFLNDAGEDAYVKQVDRLLASPRFGERWASPWLDLARYADSAGYEKDSHRDVWPYRDWVIQALNDNMSYDEFVIKQLAGDLIPDATLDDHIATVFNRLTPINNEGGTDDEEFRVVAVMDRVATTWLALSGMTMNCVQCHSHPYDPLAHEEYFTSLAFFNTSEDADKVDDAPVLKIAENDAQRIELFLKQDRQRKLNETLASQARSLTQNPDWTHLPVTSVSMDEDAGWGYTLRGLESRWENMTLKERGQIEQCRAYEVDRDAGKPIQGSDWTNYCDTTYSANTKWFYLALQRIAARSQKTTENPTPIANLPIREGEYYEPSPELAAVGEFTITLHVPAGSPARTINAFKFRAAPLEPEIALHTPQDGFGIDRMGAELHRADGTVELLGFKAFIPNTLMGQRNLISMLASDDRAIVEKTAEWKHGFLAHRLFKPTSTIGVLETPVELGAGDTVVLKLAQFQAIQPRDGKPYYLRRLHVSTTDSGSARELLSPEHEYSSLLEQSIQLEKDILAEKGIGLPVMLEQLPAERRATKVFERGNFLAKTGADVRPGTPEIFSPLFDARHTSDTGPATRLDLANWFVSDTHPLTSRVAVNRFWEQLFGLGLVETLEDFGSIGAAPSHPELLDWLAIEYQHELQWDTKALLKQIVLSSTYRQSATISPEDFEADPQNKWLSRGPRQRLTAEMVRDQALYAAGLLSEKMGGKPVMPPQPEGVWQTVYNQEKWEEAKGEDRYRRAIYTYIKRSAPYPSFETFDDVGHTTSAPRRTPTNTPLQALVTLNDIVYHEVAVALGKKMQAAAADQSFEAGISLGFEALVSRPVTSQELSILEDAFGDAVSANAATGDAEASAWTDMASALLNMDESLNR